MNKATIESIEWHKDQLFKLLGDEDLIKIEGEIHSVKTELNGIIEKAKKRVWVKPTATKKGYYREQEAGKGCEIDGKLYAGKKEDYEKVNGRLIHRGTGKAAAHYQVSRKKDIKDKSGLTHRETGKGAIHYETSPGEYKGGSKSYRKKNE